MTLSRRDLLRGLAGAGLAACARGRQAAGPRAPSWAARTRAAIASATGSCPRPQAWRDVAVAILGGGVAGLSAAWALERGGLRRLRRPRARGRGRRHRALRARTRSRPTRGAPTTCPCPPRDNRPLVALLDEIGAITGRDARGQPVYAEDVLCRDPQERVFFRGEWYEGLYPRAGATPRDLEELHAFEADMRRWSVWRDAQGPARLRPAAGPRLGRARRCAPSTALSMAAYLDARGWTLAAAALARRVRLPRRLRRDARPDVGLGGRALLRVAPGRRRRRRPTS